MFDEFQSPAERRLMHEVYPESTHKWERQGDTRPEYYECLRCKATKVIYSDVMVVVFDAQGHPSDRVPCKYLQVSEVMES